MPIIRQEASLKRFQLSIILEKTKSWRQCLCYFPCVIKCLDKSHLRGFVLAHSSRVPSITHGSYGRRGSHIVFTVTVLEYSPSSMDVMAAGT